MRSTMRQVAREAGVSIATVSRVFNGGPVGRATRERIQRVARELRYVPNRAAQSLNTARTYTLGVILPDLYGAFFSELLRHLDAAAREGGYHLLVSGSHSGAAELEAALQAMSGRVDGLVLMSAHVDDDVLETNLPATIPVLLLGSHDAGDEHASLRVDNEGGAQAVVRHLLGLGYRRIAHITSAPWNRDAAERLSGYRSAMAEAGLPTEGLVFEGDFTEASGYRIGETIASSGSIPDALFAANDSMAIGAMSAFHDAGLDVPRQIAVAGFDDIPMARFLQPALTSVRVPLDAIGEQAVHALLATITEAETPVSPRLFAPELVVRASCGAAP